VCVVESKSKSNQQRIEKFRATFCQFEYLQALLLVQPNNRWPRGSKVTGLILESPLLIDYSLKILKKFRSMEGLWVRDGGIAIL